MLLIVLLVVSTPTTALALVRSNKVEISGSPVALGIAAEWSVGDLLANARGGGDDFIQELPFSVSVRTGTMINPFSVSEPLYKGHWLTGWGTYHFAQSPSSSLGLVFGASQSWFDNSVPIIPFRKGYTRPQPPVAIVGVSIEHRWDKLWFRLTPTVSLGTRSDPYDFFHAGMLGPALAEVGYRFTPAAELSLRPSLTPIAFSMLF
jgi:hypothetical protein